MAIYNLSIHFFFNFIISYFLRITLMQNSPTKLSAPLYHFIPHFPIDLFVSKLSIIYLLIVGRVAERTPSYIPYHTHNFAFKAFNASYNSKLAHTIAQRARNASYFRVFRLRPRPPHLLTDAVHKGISFI